MVLDGEHDRRVDGGRRRVARISRDRGKNMTEETETLAKVATTIGLFCLIGLAAWEGWTVASDSHERIVGRVAVFLLAFLNIVVIGVLVVGVLAAIGAALVLIWKRPDQQRPRS